MAQWPNGTSNRDSKGQEKKKMKGRIFFHPLVVVLLLLRSLSGFQRMRRSGITRVREHYGSPRLVYNGAEIDKYYRYKPLDV